MRQPSPTASENRAHLGAGRVGGIGLSPLRPRSPEYALTIDHYGVALAVQTYEAPNSIDPAQAALRQKAALALLPEASGSRQRPIIFWERRTSPESHGGQPGSGTGPGHRRAGQVLVNLSDYLDTGLYLDSRGVRRNRGIFQPPGAPGAARAGGLAFSISSATLGRPPYRALAGAEESLSVDLSRTYLNWARDNFELNGLDGAPQAAAGDGRPGWGPACGALGKSLRCHFV